MALVSLPRGERVPPLILRLTASRRTALLGGVVVWRHLWIQHKMKELADEALATLTQGALRHLLR